MCNIQDIKVSVIVPIYNVENYLEKCIQSLQNQIHTNTEIILVNDGSSDNSLSICKKYALKDTRIKVIDKPNEGVSITRNKGIDLATGDYICFVDGDDYVMEDYTSYLLDLAVENNANISITTEMFGNFQETQVKEEAVEVWTNEEAVEKILCYKVPIGCYCKLFKRSFLGENIRFRPNLFIGEGFNFNIDAFQNSNTVVAGNRRIYYYRRDNPTSAMTKFSIVKCENGLEALTIIRNNLKVNTPQIQNAWKYANWRTHTDFYDMIKLAKAQKEYPQMYKKCLDITKKDALFAFSVPISRNNRIRAIVMKFTPALIPIAMKIRKHVFNKKS